MQCSKLAICGLVLANAAFADDHGNVMRELVTVKQNNVGREILQKKRKGKKAKKGKRQPKVPRKEPRKRHGKTTMTTTTTTTTTFSPAPDLGPGSDPFIDCTGINLDGTWKMPADCKDGRGFICYSCPDEKKCDPCEPESLFHFHFE